MTRVYLPVALPDLAGLLEAGSLVPPLRGHAVTDAVRREWADTTGGAGGGEEDWEYEALCLAAADCPPGRRFVVAADVSLVRPSDPDDPTSVVVEEPVPLRRVAAVHADLADDAAADDDLAWFATQEIPVLVAEGLL